MSELTESLKTFPEGTELLPEAVRIIGDTLDALTARVAELEATQLIVE